MPKNNEALVMSCRILLRPIARFLISAGMHYSEFMEVAKEAFVRGACDLGGDDESTAVIASRIGVGRKEVARLREEAILDFSNLAYELSLPAMVLTRWHQDPEFVLKSGAPRPLTESEFTVMLKRIDETIVPKEMLGELIGSKSIIANPDGSFSPRRRYFIPQEGDPRQILRFGIRIGDLAETLRHNSSSDAPLVEASAYNSHIAIEHLPVLRRIARIQATSLLQSLDDWLTSHATDLPNKTVRAGLGVYFFEDAVDPTCDEAPPDG